MNIDNLGAIREGKAGTDGIDEYRVPPSETGRAIVLATKSGASGLEIEIEPPLEALEPAAHDQLLCAHASGSRERTAGTNDCREETAIVSVRERLESR